MKVFFIDSRFGVTNISILNFFNHRYSFCFFSFVFETIMLKIVTYLFQIIRFRMALKTPQAKPLAGVIYDEQC